MALTKNFAINKVLVTRVSSSGAKSGTTDDEHLIAGESGSNTRYRSYARFSHDWGDVARVVKIELVLPPDNGAQPHFGQGTKPKARIRRLTEAFDGTSPGGENQWDSGDWDKPSTSTESPKDADFTINAKTGDPETLYIDITRIAKALVPTGVKMPDGSSGGGKTNHGFLITNPDPSINSQRFVTNSLKGGSPHPYIKLTYDPKNRAPVAPTLTGPATDNVAFSDAFTGNHSDPDLDPMAARNIEVYPKGGLAGGKKAVWTIERDAPDLLTAGSDETQTGVFSVPLQFAAAALKLGTDYEWRARTKDSRGSWGAYSAVRLLRITSSAPTVVASSPGTVDAMANARFGGTYSGTDPMAVVQVQMQALAPHSDAAWADPSAFVWDTGEAVATVSEVGNSLISRSYGGEAIGIGTFTVRVRAKSDRGVWSAWSYADFTVANAYDPDPGSIDMVTQIMRNAPVRVAVYDLKRDAKGKPLSTRDPGNLIGYIDDPMDLGLSGYLNGGGECYFTLPALHPYCPELEPRQRHLHVEQWYGDRYRVIWAGLLIDFDADGETMVAYATDYLGLLQTAVDERYNPTKPETAAPTGSKYVDKTIDWIIKDQLTYHKGLDDSPVGFIAIGSITALAERATIYSTYTEALPFIMGLIDSHKQGTGRESRFYCRPTNASYTAWQWALVDNWGRDRPNIRLEYGGLVNDFRVVALGDFGTRVLGVGNKRGEAKVYRATGKGGMDENDWGRVAKTAYYADIIDQNDLQRRVNEEASRLAKIGKRLALAIRADMLSPYDGWDIGDSIVIDLDRGVVDTMGYGSGGYWTIYGVEWRYYSDGHSDLTLTIMPKKSATSPDPDLIPSKNPGIAYQWQVGYGVAVNYGEPPVPTPALLSATGGSGGGKAVLPPTTDPVIARWYQDLNTGCTYELDEATGAYTNVYCPADGGTQPPVLDTTPPPVPEVLGLSSIEAEQEDGTTVVRLNARVGYTTAPAGLDDLNRYIVQVTRHARTDDPTQPDWTYALEVHAQSADNTGTLATEVVVIPVLAATRYWCRVDAEDRLGNRSSPSPVVSIVTARDSEGPPQPTGLMLLPGMSSFGLRCDPNTASDWSYNEVRWRETPAGAWDSIRIKGTVVVITGLVNGATYEVAVRAVDTSGNTLHSTGTVDADGDPVYESVIADAEPDKGWVVAGTVTPSAIPGDALAWDAAIIENVFAGKLNADWLVAGSLTVGNGVQGITVVDAQKRTVGTWTPDGLRVLDPDNPNYELVMTESSLVIWDRADPANPVQRVRVTPLGIDAASITFGSARGGHNLIPNSSFELGKFGVTQIVTSVWTAAADWNASRVGADINITTGATDLTMTAVT